MAAMAVPRRRRRRGGMVPIIFLAEAADPADGRHALGKGCEAAIGAAEAVAVTGAPRIVLRFGARAERGCRGEQREREKRGSHRHLLFCIGSIRTCYVNDDRVHDAAAAPW